MLIAAMQSGEEDLLDQSNSPHVTAAVKAVHLVQDLPISNVHVMQDCIVSDLLCSSAGGSRAAGFKSTVFVLLQR